MHQRHHFLQTTSRLLSKLEARDNCEFGREMEDKAKKKISPTLLNGYIERLAFDLVGEAKTAVLVILGLDTEVLTTLVKL